MVLSQRHYIDVKCTCGYVFMLYQKSPLSVKIKHSRPRKTRGNWILIIMSLYICTTMTFGFVFVFQFCNFHVIAENNKSWEHTNSIWPYHELIERHCRLRLLSQPRSLEADTSLRRAKKMSKPNNSLLLRCLLWLNWWMKQSIDQLWPSAQAALCRELLRLWQNNEWCIDWNTLNISNIWTRSTVSVISSDLHPHHAALR